MKSFFFKAKGPKIKLGCHLQAFQGPKKQVDLLSVTNFTSKQEMEDIAENVEFEIGLGTQRS